MKKYTKFILVTLLIIILNFVVLLNTVQAVENGTINIYTKGYFKRVIKNNGIVIKTAHAVYEKNGQEYPAYCLNRELHGVGDYIATYDVTNEGKIADVDLWRVIINAYPYKTIEQLGVVDEGEAYTATKQAIYCYIYNTGTENYEGVGASGNRIINAMNLILENARNSTETFENQKIEISQSEKWQIDNQEEYVSKEYEVKSNINISKFTINLENYPKGCKITDLQNQEKTEFNSNEKFKILIPIISLDNDGQFNIKIQTQMETKPIFFGKAPNSELQDYALTAFSYEDIDTELLQKYEKNETKIIIEKRDEETGENLEGARFQILNEENQIIKEAKTDSEGEIIFQQLMPGKYFIKEITAPEGYELDTTLIQVEIELNESITIENTNKKIVEPEEPPVEEIPIIELPKLPVTGM